MNIIIGIASFVLGLITGVYLPLKFREEDRAPKVSIGPFQERQNFFDITNHGGDILDLKVKIAWLQGRKKQERSMTDFFNASEDPAFGSSHSCNSLKRGETKKVVHCPLYSDDGKVQVWISGVDVMGKSCKESAIVLNKIEGV